MAKTYLDRSEVLKIVGYVARTWGIFGSVRKALTDKIKAIPAADVEPVKHGHIVWKKRHRGGFTQKKCIKNGGYDCDHKAVIDDRSAGEEPYCSECGGILGDWMNFCGNCGARMDGDSND